MNSKYELMTLHNFLVFKLSIYPYEGNWLTFKIHKTLTIKNNNSKSRYAVVLTAKVVIYVFLVHKRHTVSTLEL